MGHLSAGKNTFFTVITLNKDSQKNNKLLGNCYGRNPGKALTLTFNRGQGTKMKIMHHIVHTMHHEFQGNIIEISQSISLFSAKTTLTIHKWLRLNEADSQKL